jgi:folate-binding protein YgfZ
MATCIRTSPVSRRSLVCEVCVKQLPQPRAYRAASRTQQRAALSTRAFASKTSHPLRIAQPAFVNPASVTVGSIRARRNVSTTAATPAKAGIAHLTSRRLISLSGPDAAKFLQGLITNNVTPQTSTPFYAAFLDARGRVLWDAFIWTLPQPDGFACYIEVDGGEVEAMLKHLKRHKLRSKIAVNTVPEEAVAVWHAWGVQPKELDGRRLIASLRDPRGFGTEDFGTRFLLQGRYGPSNCPWSVVEEQQYHLRRYMAGIPEGPLEIPRESALPMEVNIDLSHGIDFKKGCYVGQELTIRTKHTGVVRKRILPIQLYTPSSSEPPDHAGANSDIAVPAPSPGTDIKELDENGGLKKGRAAGKIVASMGHVGLALCRLEMMTSMKVSAEGGSWKPGAEFGVQVQGNEGEEVVRVRAVVDQRFRERERDVWDKARTRV